MSMKRFVVRAFAVLAVTLAGLGILYVGISCIVASAATHAVRRPLVDTPARLNEEFVEVVFPDRQKEVLLRGWYLSAEDPRGAIIMVHGLDSNRADPDVGLVDLAAGLKKDGFSVLMFDLRGHGLSDGGRLTGGQLEQEDVLGAYDWLRKTNLFPADKKIGAWGESFGAALVILAASREPGIVAVVADSSFADVRDMLETEIPKRVPVTSLGARALIPGAVFAARHLYDIDLNRVAPARAMKNVRFFSLLIHCFDDERIPYSQSEKIKNTAGAEWVSIVSVKNCSHGQAFKTLGQDYVKIVAFYFAMRFDEMQIPSVKLPTPPAIEAPPMRYHF